MSRKRNKSKMNDLPTREVIDSVTDRGINMMRARRRDVRSSARNFMAAIDLRITVRLPSYGLMRSGLMTGMHSGLNDYEIDA